MTIVYDMATGSIQSEQEQAHDGSESDIVAPETALQPVHETGCAPAPDTVSIHLIRALLNQN